MEQQERDLDNFFQRYKTSCPDIEPNVNFMPQLWKRIEARRSFSFAFQRLARAAMAVSAVLSLLLLLLNAASDLHPLAVPIAPTYADALAADHTVETTYYAEAIRGASSPDESLDGLENSNR